MNKCRDAQLKAPCVLTDFIDEEKINDNKTALQLHVITTLSSRSSSSSSVSSENSNQFSSQAHVVLILLPRTNSQQSQYPDDSDDFNNTHKESTRPQSSTIEEKDLNKEFHNKKLTTL